MIVVKNVVNIVFVTLLNEVREHRLHLIKFELARSAKAQQVEIIELAKWVELLKADPLPELVEHLCLLLGEVSHVP
jgi:hypothetical protein